MIGGFPNLSRERPRKAPKRAAKMRAGRDSLAAAGAFKEDFMPGRRWKRKRVKSKAQFEQAHFQGEGFLDIAAQAALKLFKNSQVFQRIRRVDPLGNMLCPRHLRKIQKLVAWSLRAVSTVWPL